VITTARHRPRRWLLGIAVLLVAAGLAWLVFTWWAQPGEPSSFYDPPDELAAGASGTIVRDEALDDAGAGRKAWRVLYTSTDPAGSPIAVSGVVVTPDGPPPAGGRPVVAWAHGTTGVDRRCAPSIDDPESGLVRVPELDGLLASGAVVAITDYPGLGTPGPHPYLVGESEGRAVLDSIRAARSLLGEEHVAPTAVIYGHSQGGHSSVWARDIASTYAPELDIAGVAAMAPPTDLGTLMRDDEKQAQGIVLAALALSSWSEYYPDADLASVVDPPARSLVRDIGSRCIATTDQGLTDIPEVLALQTTFLSTDPSTAPGWSQHLRENSAGDASTPIPLLVSQGLDDALVRPEVTTAYVRAQCAAGANIQFDTYPGVGHFEVRTVAAPTVRDWLVARLRGEPLEPGCRDSVEPSS
jgi:hypothetical protein